MNLKVLKSEYEICKYFFMFVFLEDFIPCVDKMNLPDSCFKSVRLVFKIIKLQKRKIYRP